MEEKTLQHSVAKPFLKWAGGKRQLLQAFEDYFPNELKNGSIEHYIEPFLGSGAVFFHLAQFYSFKHAILADINPAVVQTYLMVKKAPDELLQTLKHLENQYLKASETKRKEFYYQKRTRFNQLLAISNLEEISHRNIERAALVIFLNKTCYNGLFRLNSRGEFNTPAGTYKNPKICDENNLLAVSELLQHAEIKLSDFRFLEKYPLPEQHFIYLDPPYRPISKTSSFTSYSQNSFSDRDQIELSALYGKLSEQGHLLMLSNSDPKNHDSNDSFFDDLYKGFSINRIPARRYINSQASKRGAVNELLITNYKPNR